MDPPRVRVTHQVLLTSVCEIFCHSRIEPTVSGNGAGALQHHSLLSVVYRRKLLLALELPKMPRQLHALRRPRHKLQVELPDALA